MSKHKFKFECEDRHCRRHPNALKPYKKMRRIPLTDLSEKILEKFAEEYGIKRECVPCIAVKHFFEKVGKT